MATGPDNPIPPGPPSGARHADDPSLPAPLVADLRAAFASPPPIPQAVDRAVLDDARVLLRPRPAIIFTFRRAALALSTAAALALVAYVAIPSRRPAGPLDGLQLTDSRSRPAENTARSIESAGPSAATTPAAPGTAGGHDVAGASRPDRRSAADLPPAADRDVALAAKPKAEAQGPTIVDALRIAIALRDQQSDARAGRPLRRLDELYDITGDGVIDLRDVDALAQRVVSLQPQAGRAAADPLDHGGAE